MTQQLKKNKLTHLRTKVKTLQHNRLDADSFFSTKL